MWGDPGGPQLCRVTPQAARGRQGTGTGCRDHPRACKLGTSLGQVGITVPHSQGRCLGARRQMGCLVLLLLLQLAASLQSSPTLRVLGGFCVYKGHVQVAGAELLSGSHLLAPLPNCAQLAKASFGEAPLM